MHMTYMMKHSWQGWNIIRSSGILVLILYTPPGIHSLHAMTSLVGTTEYLQLEHQKCYTGFRVTGFKGLKFHDIMGASQSQSY